ncbi:MAG: ribokinase [Chloroflexi bacterium]|nr:ribokinase [Chloroflexota bacterium]
MRDRSTAAARLSSPDFLVVGHVTKDLYQDGYRIGGTVTFAAITAARLGRRPAVLTRAAADLPLAEALPGVEVLRLPSPVTTTFENVYGPTGRHQIVHAVAEPLRCSDVPPDWQRIPIVLLGPLVQEIGPDMAACFEGLIGVTPQGWMRQWNDAGRVSSRPWDCAEHVLLAADVLVLSEEDLGGDLAPLHEYVRLCPTVVLTTGWQGATVFLEGERYEVPPRPAREMDPTGAGDIFTAAFLIRLEETGDPLLAARFANVVASFSVEQSGTESIPPRAQVEGWLAAHS